MKYTDNQEELYQKAQAAAKELADETTPIMIRILKSYNIDDNGIFQGMMLDLYSAFYLSTTIKLLRDMNIPQEVINEMLAIHLGLALDMAKKSKFKIHKDN